MIHNRIGLRVSVLTVSMLLAGGCGSIEMRNSNDSATSNNGEVLSASVDDPIRGEYRLVAEKQSTTSDEWAFSVRSARRSSKPHYTFQWDFDDGTVSEGTNQIHTFNEPGTYNVTVTAVTSRDAVAFVLSLTIEIPAEDNVEPVAIAGDDDTVNENGLVFLYGGQSYDPDGDPLTYEWTQLSGPPVNLLQASLVTASFVAPAVSADTTLEFELTVSDGRFTSTDTVNVVVFNTTDPASLEPVAKAGDDEFVVEGSEVVLDGSASDGGGAVLSYAWTQLSGQDVTLTGADTARATFAAPAVSGSQQLVFELVVTANDAAGSDEVVITVVEQSDGTGDPCAVDADGDGINDCDDGCPTDPNKTAPGECGCGESDADADGNGLPDCFTDTQCITATNSWVNEAVSVQTGVFSAEMDVTPSTGGLDGIVALSDGAGSAFGNYAVLIRFNNSGAIDVRHGSTYTADETVSYVGGQTYHVRVDVDIPLSTYDVYVTPPGSASEIAVALGFGFRSENVGVAQLNNLGAWAGSGSIEVCGFSVGSGGPLTVGAGSDKSVIAGGSLTLDGSVGGGTGVYNITWSPGDGLSDAKVIRPSASPAETTTYTLTVVDSDGESGTDTMTVTVESSPLAVDAGQDTAIPGGGSVQLNGTAIGGTPPYSYSWAPSTGLSDATAANPTASPASATTYTLTVTDSDGASASDSVTVSIIDGTVFYVDKNHPSASDTNAGTEAAPWKTLGKAAATAQSGDTVFVKAGVYYETISPSYSGAAGAPITFAADPSAACQGGKTKSACAVTIDGGGTRDGAVSIKRDYIRIEGFEMTNHGGGLLAEVIHVQGRGVEIVNNYVHDNDGSGVVSIQGGSEGLLVDNNEMTELYRGVLFNGNDMTFRDNHIWNIRCDGIRGGGDNTLIDGNSIHSAQIGSNECHMDALDLGAGVSNRGLIVRNNTIYDFTQLVYIYAYSGNSVEDVEIYGNVIYTDKYWSDFGGEAQGVFVDARRSTTSARNITVHSNTFAWVGYDAVWILGQSNNITNVSVRNNILYEGGLNIQSVSNLDNDYNLYYESSSNVGMGPNSFIANPKFANHTRHGAYDLRLASDSSAVNAGATSAGSVAPFPTPFLDMDGTPRPNGGGYDIGALER